jgi:hypothetical protein
MINWEDRHPGGGRGRYVVRMIMSRVFGAKFTSYRSIFLKWNNTYINWIFFILFLLFGSFASAQHMRKHKLQVYLAVIIMLRIFLHFCYLRIASWYCRRMKTLRNSQFASLIQSVNQTHNIRDGHKIISFPLSSQTTSQGSEVPFRGSLVGRVEERNPTLMLTNTMARLACPGHHLCRVQECWQCGHAGAAVATGERGIEWFQQADPDPG